LITRAVSTFSLTRTLGRIRGPFASVDGDGAGAVAAAPGALSLLDLPAELRTHGYDAVQICHAQFPARDSAYLAELRSSLAASGITLDAVLVDAGDVTHPTDAARHEAWISDWIDVATELGATRARVCAGRSAPTADTLRQGGEALARLAASHPGIRVITENWLELLADADAVLAVREITGDDVGLMIDLGNWHGAGKYDELARIAPFAETCHAKCEFSADGPDRDDFLRSLTVLHNAGFDGSMALIYSGPDDDEWTNLDLEWEMVQSVFA
jgi:hypothetical protein